MTSTNGRWRRWRGRIQCNRIDRGWHWHRPPRARAHSVPKFKAKSNANNLPFTPPSQNIIVFGKWWDERPSSTFKHGFHEQGATTAVGFVAVGYLEWGRRVSWRVMSPAHPPNASSPWRSLHVLHIIIDGHNLVPPDHTLEGD